MGVGVDFRPLRDFDCPELKSHYHAGLLYTVRPGNEILRDFVAKWIEAGLVEIATENKAEASVGGSAEVK